MKVKGTFKKLLLITVAAGIAIPAVAVSITYFKTNKVFFYYIPGPTPLTFDINGASAVGGQITHSGDRNSAKFSGVTVSNIKERNRDIRTTEVINVIVPMVEMSSTVYSGATHSALAVPIKMTVRKYLDGVAMPDPVPTVLTGTADLYFPAYKGRTENMPYLTINPNVTGYTGRSMFIKMVPTSSPIPAPTPRPEPIP